MLFAYLIISLSATLILTHAQEGTVCTMPNLAQSMCVRLHLCENFQTIIRNAGGRPSPDQVAHIRKHSCGGNNLVCCPDRASAPTTTTTTTPRTMMPMTFGVSQPQNNVDLPARTNLNTIKSHRNINLINEKKCGVSVVTDRIIGGTEAQLGEFPWMALLQYKSRLENSFSFNCGGTLITPRYVLTAGHCITRDLVAVRLGEYKISTTQDCNHDNVCTDPVQDIAIETVIKHPKYSNQKKINDIALLRLKTPADVSGRFVKTICLPTTQENQIDSIDQLFRDKMTITGWGKIESGKQSDVLLKAYIPYVKHDPCVSRFARDNIPVYETYLCAGGKNKTDTCNGDSGGPIQSIATVNSKQRSVIYGVVSVGIQCLNPEAIYPGIYTNVAYYLDWILDNIS